MFNAIFGWLYQLWQVLETPLFIMYGLEISYSDIILGGFITCFVISVFWKGAKA